MAEDDDWGITPDFKIEMTEQEQRWGSKVVTGPGRMGHIDMKELRESVVKSDAEAKKNTIPKASYGYGGKFGVEKDRMDQTAVGNEYKAEAAKHTSQQDYSKGFGGRYGVQTDRQDKSAVGYDHHETVAQHPSQTDHSVGFGGKYGIQTDKKDASSHDYKDMESTDRHESQIPKSFATEGASNTASALRAKFEALALDQSKPVERPQRPVSKLPTHFMPKQTEQQTEKEHINVPMHKLESIRQIEPVVQQEPVRQPSLEPVRQPSPERVHQHSPEPVRQPSPEPVRQPSPEPVRQPSPEPVRQPSPEPEAQPAPVIESCITAMALYNFDASQDDELSLTAGDQITNINKFDETWWFGMVGDRKGIFPANFVGED